MKIRMILVVAILNEKAALRAETEKELERQKLINQQADNNILEAQKKAEVAAAQLIAEQAQTQVDVEIASREGKKIAAQYEVYSTNLQAYELRRLELMQKFFSDKTTYFFIPEGTDLNAFFNGSGLAIPK
jgi:regulator of protease activity HflC (stomatin/prohibitin superfamily)